MASDRDTLTEPVRHQLSRAAERTLEKLYLEWGITPGLPTPAVAIHRFADKLAEEGWRPPARVIETPEDLHALPVGAVVLSDAGAAWTHVTETRWEHDRSGIADAYSLIANLGRVTVAWEPKAGEQR